MQHLVILLLFILVVIITGCGWHLQKNAAMNIPDEMKIMIFNSKIPNNSLNFAIRNQLCLNGINLIENSLHQDVPSICVLNSTLNQNVISIFQDGYTAERQVILLVDISISLPNGSIYPIKIKIYHSFFNNPYTALIKDIEQQIIINEMYNKVAEELIRRLQSIKIIKIPTSKTSISINNSHSLRY